MAAADKHDPLMGAAASISDGDAVDWTEMRRRMTDEESTAVLEELQVLDGIAQIHRNQWGALDIIEPIGHGAFGTVYRALDRDLQRHVALKVTRPAANGVAFDPERLVQEAQRLARIKHPNVVVVYSAERRGNEVAVAMEWIKGQTLDAIVQARGPLSAKEVALIGVDVCRALAAVHAAGLLHGDIKANNVMREDGGRVVLMDFGASRDLARMPGAGNDFAGTPLYIAPEVFAGAPRSKASDVYSLGVLLYYLSTGRYPVDGDTRTAIDRQHAQTIGRRHLRDVRPDLPDEFVRTVQHAIAENPAERYQTAGALEQALIALLGGDVVLPRPSWRRPTLLMAAALVLAAVVAALLLYNKAGRGNAEAITATAPASTVKSVSLATPPADTPANPVPPPYQVEATFYRVDPDKTVRLAAGERVGPGDRLYLDIQTSVPAHVYVVNEDEEGHHYLLYPLNGDGQSKPLPAGQRHHLPGMRGNIENYWQVTSPGGHDHFVVFVSPTPLTALEASFAQLPRASEDTPVVSMPVGSNAMNVLRGVGGVVPSTTPRLDQPLYEQYKTPLPATGETTSGIWIRQLTVRSTP